MEFILSIEVTQSARPDEIEYAIRKAGELAGRYAGMLADPLPVDNEINIGSVFVADVACGIGAILHRIE